MSQFWTRLRTLPRVAYWALGAFISCAGALGARFISEAFPLEERVPIWLAGSAVVFAGLYVLSLGTRARLNPESSGDIDANADT